MKNVYDLLLLIKKLRIRLPLDITFVPPCQLGDNVVPKIGVEPLVRSCAADSWQQGFWVYPFPISTSFG